MGTQIFLGKPPANVEQWIKNQKLKEPLCFTAVDAGATITFNKNGNPDAANIVTSTDKQTWTPYTFGTTITLANVGDKVYFRATDENDISFCKDHDAYYRFSTMMGKRVAASGNLQTLMKADGSRLDLSGKNRCYAGMFINCSSLTTAPILPATNLAEACYADMFMSCTSLTAAPSLPAMTLTNNCYQNMFRGCTSLTTAPALPATTIASSCYQSMFQGCSSLSSVEVAFTEWTSGATTNWLNNVAASGIFTCPSTLPDTRGINNIPEGWTKVDK